MQNGHLRICRLCMSKKNLKREVANKLIYCKIRECLQVEIDPHDANLPTAVCTRCTKIVRKFYIYRKACWKVQRMLISKLRHSDFIEIVNVGQVNLSMFRDVPLEYEQERSRTFYKKDKNEMMVEIQEVVRKLPTQPADPPVDEQIKIKPITSDLASEKTKETPICSPLDSSLAQEEILYSDSHGHEASSNTIEQEPDFTEGPPETTVIETDTLDQEQLDEEVFDLEALEPETLDPETLETEMLETETLEVGDLELASETETMTADVNDEIVHSPEGVKTLETESHLMPHDYTTKQAYDHCPIDPAAPRAKPRRRRTNVSGSALYKSLLTPCDVCGKNIERNRMEGHRNRHFGIRPYDCPIEGCNSAFHCKHACRLHVRCRHGNESFPCDVCGKTYRARRDLLGHKREAHTDPKFECEVCAKKFTTRSRLKQHQFYHTGERNHHCPFCTMKFFNNFQLKVHLRTHTQARPFVCKVCNKDFRYRHMAKDHIVRQHGIDESLERDWIFIRPDLEIIEMYNLVKSENT